MKISACNKCYLAFAFLTSLTEIICAITYQFHAVGFTLGLIYLVVTPVMYFSFFDTKREPEPSVIGDNHNMKENLNPDENSTEKEEKPSCLKRIVWVLYVIYGVILFFLMFIRLFVLCRRTEWRSDLNDAFPAECGDWAAKDGCTRLVMDAEGAQGGCVKVGDLPTEDYIILDVGGDDLNFNGQIQKCIDGISGSKLHSPSTIDDISTTLPQVHITFQSAFFGFLDDMYLMTAKSEGYTDQIRTLSMQSQLRIGSSDFN